ncbi:hypothetical protein Tco_0766943 [Tanacetum coccineum]
MLRTLRGNGPYGCEFDSMGLLCLKWNVLHVFTVILHNCPLFEILAQRLDFFQTYELTYIFVDLFEYHFQVLRMISEVALQVLADHKSILYGLRSERFGVEFCVELKTSLKSLLEMKDHHDTIH